MAPTKRARFSRQAHREIRLRCRTSSRPAASPNPPRTGPSATKRKRMPVSDRALLLVRLTADRSCAAAGRAGADDKRAARRASGLDDDAHAPESCGTPAAVQLKKSSTKVRGGAHAPMLKSVRYQIGHWTFVPSAHELRSGGARARLQQRASATLSLTVRARGRSRQPAGNHRPRLGPAASQPE